MRAVLGCGVIVAAGGAADDPAAAQAGGALTCPGSARHTRCRHRAAAGSPIVLGLLVARGLVRRRREPSRVRAAVGFFGAARSSSTTCAGCRAVRRLRLRRAWAAPGSPRCSSPRLRLPPVALAALRRGDRGVADGLRQRLQLHGRGQRHLCRARPDRRGGLRVLRGSGARTRFLRRAWAWRSPSGACAFLPWNAGRARVFLGDVGSYALGAALAVLAVTALIHGRARRGGRRPAGPLPGGYRLDPAAAGAGRGALG